MTDDEVIERSHQIRQIHRVHVYATYYGTRCSKALPVAVPIEALPNGKWRPSFKTWLSEPYTVEPALEAPALDDPDQTSAFIVVFEHQYSRKPADRNFLLHRLRSQVGKMEHGPVLVFKEDKHGRIAPPRREEVPMITRLMINVIAANYRECISILRDAYEPHMGASLSEAEEEDTDDDDLLSNNEDESTSLTRISASVVNLYPDEEVIQARISGMRLSLTCPHVNGIYFGVNTHRPVVVPIYLHSAEGSGISALRLGDWIAFDFRRSSSFNLEDHMVTLPDYQISTYRYVVVWESQKAREEPAFSPYLHSLRSCQGGWYGNLIVVRLDHFDEVLNMSGNDDIETGRMMAVNAMDYYRLREMGQ